MASNRPSFESDKLGDDEQRLQNELSVANSTLQPETSASWLRSNIQTNDTEVMTFLRGGT